jgi:3'-phosphoadenosine 5'-phosphosulfate sulfotransferase (PAPS reductase)/FAD synthetase
VKNLAHSAAFHSKEKIAPSKSGIKHLVGNVQIAFSGGRTSAYMLRQIMNANYGIPDRAMVTFRNTGREMPQRLDFVAEV